MRRKLFGLFRSNLSNSEATSVPGLVAPQGSLTKGFDFVQSLALVVASERRSQSVIFGARNFKACVILAAVSLSRSGICWIAIQHLLLLVPRPFFLLYCDVRDLVSALAVSGAVSQLSSCFFSLGTCDFRFASSKHPGASYARTTRMTTL
jgi:hypothetical protein